MVGDTPYDADTARDAGAICLGVTCGGMNDRKTLRATGMRQVYRDPADLDKHLDEALRIASPGSAVLDKKLGESLMREALKVARQGLDRGEMPIGCVIARGDGRIIAAGHNEVNGSQSKIAHAEMVAFERTRGQVATDALDLILVTTLEPCVMCLGASMEAAVDTILFAHDAPTDGGRMRVRPPVSPESQMPRIMGGVLRDESRKLFEEFLGHKPSNPMQVKFVTELLASS
jgi:tRNA(adenine34) deaminase